MRAPQLITRGRSARLRCAWGTALMPRPTGIADGRGVISAVRGLAVDRTGLGHPNDFVLVAMLGLFGLRIFEVTSAYIDDLGE